MQTIYIDISNKMVLPTIYAKQNDVGRKFDVVFTDAGVPYNIPEGALFSVWYDGDSGDGNYSSIGDSSAFSVAGNMVSVELIAQMLMVPGTGELCLVMNHADGQQIGFWNIRYQCEGVPGHESPGAQQYYTALTEFATEAAQSADRAENAAALAENRLSLSGGTMTGAIAMGGNQIKGLGTPTENGDAVPKSYVDNGFAPAGYGLGGNAATIADLNTLVSGFYKWDASEKNRPFDYGTAIVLSRDGSSGAEICIGITGAYKGVIVVRTKNSEGWIEEYVNPPMVPGVEYRTTERWAGAPVYTMLIEAGAIPNASRSATSYPNSIVPSRVLRVCGQISSGETLPARFGSSVATVCASRSYIYIETNDGTWSTHAAQVQVWYTK